MCVMTSANHSHADCALSTIGAMFMKTNNNVYAKLVVFCLLFVGTTILSNLVVTKTSAESEFFHGVFVAIRNISVVLVALILLVKAFTKQWNVQASLDLAGSCWILPNLIMQLLSVGLLFLATKTGEVPPLVHMIGLDAMIVIVFAVPVFFLIRGLKTHLLLNTTKSVLIALIVFVTEAGVAEVLSFK